MRNRAGLITQLLMVVALALTPLAVLPQTAQAQTSTEDHTRDRSTNFMLDVALNGLEDLGDDFVYEGWLIVDGAPVSTGIFRINADGELSDSSFDVSAHDRQNAAAFVLTIEPAVDDDPAPSDVHVLGGELVDGSAALSVGHAAALGDDFSTAAGSFILAAPSGGEEQPAVNGIWWLDPTTGPGPGLDLPTLPAGWTYEGWVVGEDGPISTGTFTSVTGADSDAGGPTAGPEDTPPFPGQDFVDPAIDLTGYSAVISIEPVPDNSPAPFAFKPLVDINIENLTSATNPLQVMMNQANTLATGTVTFLQPLTLNFNGLEDLGNDFVYEGWLIVDGAPVSTGLFSINENGALSETTFWVSGDVRDNATDFVLTIEPAVGDDPAPSDVHVLGGSFENGIASLNTGHPAALGTDFADASGSFILAAPSGGEEQPHVNGIWWLDPNAGPGPALNLPELPAGWAYEGWVVGEDGPISTGTFTSVTGADSDAGGPTAGPEGTPPFPGQDFVDPAIDLTGYAAVISVEPVPDNSPAPFTFKPLVDTNIEDLGMGVLQAMENQSATIASGTAFFLTELKLSVEGLEDLGQGWVYEGWIIVDGMPVSTGLFTIDAEGVQSEQVFMIDARDARAATAFVLTIEPTPDDDPAPSAVHVLAGDLTEGLAELTVGHPAALGSDFSDASGSFILAAPSGGEAQSHVNGLWWLDPAGGPSPSLNLPELPEGWIYEGWVVGADGPISTGRFTSVSGADSDGAGPAAGPEGTPPFPGQDFVSPAIDLTSGYAAVISIEPVPDNSPAPFAYKPLIDPSIEDTGAGVLQEMELHLETLATGTVLIMAAEQADVIMEEAMPEPAAEGEAEMVIAAQGEFKGSGPSYQGAGTATIYTEGDSRTLHLSDFSVTNGPDLHVLLISNTDATSTDGLGDYIDLGSLKGNMGDQNYEIPADVDLSQYSGVMIYCVPFHVPFATAAFGG
ncbi:MAG: DM13 domain-containing protein [Chloroflexota bacterium]